MGDLLHRCLPFRTSSLVDRGNLDKYNYSFFLDAPIQITGQIVISPGFIKEDKFVRVDTKDNSSRSSVVDVECLGTSYLARN